LCLRKGSISFPDFKPSSCSARNFENSKTFASLLFSGGLLRNGIDDGAFASAHTDESNSLGLSNCSKIVESSFSVQKREEVENSYIPGSEDKKKR
jgi:hypothetical protein